MNCWVNVKKEKSFSILVFFLSCGDPPDPSEVGVSVLFCKSFYFRPLQCNFEHVDSVWNQTWRSCGKDGHGEYNEEAAKCCNCDGNHVVASLDMPDKGEIK